MSESFAAVVLSCCAAFALLAIFLVLLASRRASSPRSIYLIGYGASFVLIAAIVSVAALLGDPVLAFLILVVILLPVAAGLLFESGKSR